MITEFYGALNPVVAILLPWLAGSLVVSTLFRGDRVINFFALTGHGYFAGFCIVAFITRLAAQHHWPVQATVYLVMVLISTVSMLYLFVRPERSNKKSIEFQLPTIMWEKGVVILIIVVVSYRYTSIFLEMIHLQIFPWDAWMNWAPKALIWLNTGEFNTFVNPTRWLQEGSPELYTLGNYRAAEYPDFVPLVYFWMMTTAGADSGLLHLPWLFAPVALGCAIYGHLRLMGVGVAPAVIAFYLFANLPYVNVHTILAGYADLWMVSVFSLAVFALHAWETTANKRWLVTALFWCAACIWVKQPGVVFCLIVFISIVRVLLKPKPSIELTAVSAMLLLGAALVLTSAEFRLPIIGNILLSTNHITVGALLDQPIVFYNISYSVLDSLFTSSNWNLVFYLATLSLALWLASSVSTGILSLGFCLITTSLALIFVFSFTPYGDSAIDNVTLNRTILYLVPITIVTATLNVWRSTKRNTTSSRLKYRNGS
ncbi:hypothetical protein [Parahaliea mediterranea]|uniref:hypothetical protein n=1 Tax=Parahaliea mediterranea TaxID=651086 RepID=UPI000E2FCBC7|nr:hypothetical protein [Parahaliea mediterranea]